MIPTQCFDPLSTSIYNYVCEPTGTFQESPNEINNGDQFTIKIDQDLTKNQKLSVYYYFDDDFVLDPFAKFQAAGGNLGNFPGSVQHAYTTVERHAHLDDRHRPT